MTTLLKVMLEWTDMTLRKYGSFSSSCFVLCKAHKYALHSTNHSGIYQLNATL